MITGFSIDIYDCDLSFAINTNEKELNQFFDQIGLPDEGRKAYYDMYKEDPHRKIEAITCDFGTPNYLIVFNCELCPKAVSHEIYHAACRILQSKGIEDEEAYAYLIGYITDMFYQVKAEYDAGRNDKNL